jgi:carbon-monoxide dehydrogenase small subunit
MSEHTITTIVNDKTITRSVESRLLLCDFIRDHLHLRGTHIGCEHGVCGACTILMDGRLARSCLTFAVQAEGASVVTVEALGTAANLHVIQRAFTEEHALQCGFCTPAMLLTAYELLTRNPDPTEEQVIDAVSGNLCRCTGYQTIVSAVLRAASQMKQTPKEGPHHE